MFDRCGVRGRRFELRNVGAARELKYHREKCHDNDCSRVTVENRPLRSKSPSTRVRDLPHTVQSCIAPIQSAAFMAHSSVDLGNLPILRGEGQCFPLLKKRAPKGWGGFSRSFRCFSPEK